MRRISVALLLCLLLTATGLTLAGMAAVVSSPPPLEPAGSKATAALVRRLYDAANDVIRTGNEGVFDAILAPDFVVLGFEPSAGADLAAFQNHLVALHSTYPSLQLSIEDLVAGQDVVVVQLALRGVDRGEFAGALIASSIAPWGTTDVLRIRNGLVAEFWGHGGMVLRPRFNVDIPTLPSGPVSIELNRLRFINGVGSTVPVDRWPRLIRIESGDVTLSIRTSRAGSEGRQATITWATAGFFDAAEIVDQGGSASLKAGDVAVIPGGVASTLGWMGSLAVEALVLSIRPSDVKERGDITIDPRTGDAPSPRETIFWPLGTLVERMASWEVETTPGEYVRLAAGWLALEPGDTFEVGDAAGPILLAIEAGSIELTTVEGGVGGQPSRTVEDPTDGSAAPSPARRRERAVAGDGVLLPAGTAAVLSTAEAESVTCLVFVLVHERR